MIETEKEPSNLGQPYEPCCFCGWGTPYWSVKKDVPVCNSCSKKRNEDEVPTKVEWGLGYRLSD